MSQPAAIWERCPWCEDDRHDLCRPDLFWCGCSHPTCLIRLDDDLQGGTMTDASARGWGRATDRGYRETNIVPCRAAGLAVPVHKDVVDVFRYLLTQLAKHYPLAGYADDWGYCLRCIRGTGPGLHDPSCRLSNHSWGLAVDLDSSKNPMTSDLHAAHEIIRQVVDPILAPFGGRLVWGGEYQSARKDYMHFEYVGAQGNAAADSATARRLLAPAAAPNPHPFHAGMVPHGSYPDIVKIRSRFKVAVPPQGAAFFDDTLSATLVTFAKSRGITYDRHAITAALWKEIWR